MTNTVINTTVIHQTAIHQAQVAPTTQLYGPPPPVVDQEAGEPHAQLTIEPPKS